MEFFETAESRYSCRNYLNQPVEEEKLIKCIETARRSPSACNSQPWKFIIINQSDILSQVKPLVSGKFNMNKFVLEAPAIIIMVNEGGNFISKVGDLIKDKDFSSVGMGIAAENFCLAATAQGLCTCIMGMFEEKNLKKLLGIPSGKKISVVISVGYEKTKPIKKTNRKEIDAIMSFNKY